MVKKSIEHLKWRYAVKKFDSEKMLSKDKIEGLKHAFNLTATSYGLQPIKMVVVQNKDLQKKMVSCSFGQRQVENASHVLVICIENKIDKAFIDQYFSLVKSVRGTSDSLLKPFKEALVESFSKKEMDEIKNMVYQSSLFGHGKSIVVLCFGRNRFLSYGRIYYLRNMINS